ncbi:MAG: NUDIX hydrolase [Candidatus Dormibacteria bacterium]
MAEDRAGSDAAASALEQLMGTLRPLAEEPARPVNLRAAGVLALIDGRRAELPLLLERRSHRLRSHPGQVGLPGGSLTDSDGTLWRAALREAEEELGVPSDAVRLLGYLEPVVITHSGFLMVPAVALLTRDFTPCADPSEVSGWFWLPLLQAHTGVADVVRRRRTSRGSLLVPGYLQGRDFVWGAARVVVDRLRRGLGEQFPEPDPVREG